MLEQERSRTPRKGNLAAATRGGRPGRSRHALMGQAPPLPEVRGCLCPPLGGRGQPPLLSLAAEVRGQGQEVASRSRGASSLVQGPCPPAAQVGPTEMDAGEGGQHPQAKSLGVQGRRRLGACDPTADKPLLPQVLAARRTPALTQSFRHSP